MIDDNDQHRSLSMMHCADDGTVTGTGSSKAGQPSAGRALTRQDEERPTPLERRRRENLSALHPLHAGHQLWVKVVDLRVAPEGLARVEVAPPAAP